MGKKFKSKFSNLSSLPNRKGIYGNTNSEQIKHRVCLPVLSLQLYMVPDIRSSVLAAEGAVTDMEEDFSGDEKQDTEVGVSESWFSHLCLVSLHDFCLQVVFKNN